MHAIALNGLHISDCDGRNLFVPASRITATTDPATALSKAQLILVTVKSNHTRDMATLIAAHAPDGATVVSFQNGLDNARVLEEVLGTRVRVVAGMVPFNIVQTRDAGDVPHMHRATSGRIHIAAGHRGLADSLDVTGARVVQHNNMPAIAWGKLVLNLNNALNALCGMPLAQELSDRRWRLILAAQAEEALAVLKAAAIKPARVDGVDPRLLPIGLRLPDFLFRITARSMLAIDARARSSMWDDLQRRRATEIEYLQGAVIRLAATSQTAVPLTQRIRDLIREAETAGNGSPSLSPQDVVGNLVELA